MRSEDERVGWCGGIIDEQVGGIHQEVGWGGDEVEGRRGGRSGFGARVDWSDRCEVCGNYGKGVTRMRSEMDAKLASGVGSSGGGPGTSGFGGKVAGLLTFTDMTEDSFSGKEDDWKKWKERKNN